MRLAIDQGEVERTLELAHRLLPRLTDDRRVWLYNFSAGLRPPVLFMVGSGARNAR